MNTIKVFKYFYCNTFIEYISRLVLRIKNILSTKVALKQNAYTQLLKSCLAKIHLRYMVVISFRRKQTDNTFKGGMDVFGKYFFTENDFLIAFKICIYVINDTIQFCYFIFIPWGAAKALLNIKLLFFTQIKIEI